MWCHAKSLLVLSFTFFSLVCAKTTPVIPSGWVNGSGGVISDFAELLWFSETPDAWDEEWELSANIDASSTKDSLDTDTLSAISGFSGTFNGKGFSIDSLKVESGLFSSISGGTVSNLRLQGIEVFGVDSIGGLAGFLDSGSVISNVSISGLEINGNIGVGGLAGVSYLSKIEHNILRSGEIEGDSLVGGLIGKIVKGSVEKSNVLADVKGSSIVGGFIGLAIQPDMEYIYSAGSVDGDSLVGGLIGENNKSLFQYSFSLSNVTGSGNKIGGLIGVNHEDSPLTHFYVSGLVSASGKEVGIVVGYNYNGQITNALIDFKDSSVTAIVGLEVQPQQAMFTVIDSLSFGTQSATDSLKIDTLWDFNGKWIVAKRDSLYGIERPYFRYENKLYSIIIDTAKGKTNRGDGWYSPGDSVELKMTPWPGHKFVGWKLKGGIDSGFVSENNPFSFVFNVDSNQEYIAIVEEEYTFDGGNGSVEAPYQINNYEQLKYLSYVESLRDKAFVLRSNIFASDSKYEDKYKGKAKGFRPIRNFSGVFDGFGNVITDLMIDRPKESQVGLFGSTSSAQIKDLSIQVMTVRGKDNVGALIGHAEGTTINDGSTWGVDVTGENYVGLFTGLADSITILSSRASGTVQATGVAGGMVGYIRSDSSSIYQSFSDASVVADTAGGMVGATNLSISLSRVSESYAAGSVQGVSLAGGFIGYNSIELENIYALGDVSGGTTGGLVGYSNREIGEGFARNVVSGTSTQGVGHLQILQTRGVYYDTTFNNIDQINVNGDVKLNTEQFSDTANFIGFDFGTVWDIVLLRLTDSIARPYFRWELDSVDVSFRVEGKGHLVGDLTQRVLVGGNSTEVSAVAEYPYHFSRWNSDRGNFGSINPLQIDSLRSSYTITALFEINRYLVEYELPDGIFTNRISEYVTHGERTQYGQGFSDIEGYHVVGWMDGDSNVVSNTNPISVDSIVSDTVFYPIVQKRQYSINVTNSGKAIVSLTDSQPYYGDTVGIDVQVINGYQLDSIKINGITYYPSDDGEPLEVVVTNNMEIEVFTSPVEPVVHKFITGSGEINTNVKSAQLGDTIAYSVRMDHGMELDRITFNGDDITDQLVFQNDIYTFETVFTGEAIFFVYANGTGGKITYEFVTGKGRITINDDSSSVGDYVEVTIELDEGYELDSVLVNGKNHPYTTVVDPGLYLIYVLYGDDYDIEVFASEISIDVLHRVVTGKGHIQTNDSLVDLGDSLYYNVSLDSGYYLDSIVYNGENITGNYVDSKTFSFVELDFDGKAYFYVYSSHRIENIFVTGDGRVQSNSQSVSVGDTISYSIFPTKGLAVDSVLFNGENITALAYKSIEGYFYYDVEFSGKAILHVYASTEPIFKYDFKGGYGDITVDYEDIPPKGDTVLFYILPEKNYQLDSVVFNGENVTDQIFIRDARFVYQIEYDGVAELFAYSSKIDKPGKGFGFAKGKGKVVTNIQSVEVLELVTFEVVPEFAYGIDSVTFNGKNIMDQLSLKDGNPYFETIFSGEARFYVFASERELGFDYRFITGEGIFTINNREPSKGDSVNILMTLYSGFELDSVVFNNINVTDDIEKVSSSYRYSIEYDGTAILYVYASVPNDDDEVNSIYEFFFDINVLLEENGNALIVDSEEPVRVSVIGVNGVRHVVSDTYNKKWIIPIDYLQSGVYFIEVYDTLGKRTIRSIAK